jgi:transcriptional regulator with XRE-family HTH domain
MISQTEVFRRTGINNKSLSRYENDRTEPDAESLKALAELYGVSFDWLYGKDEKESVYTLPESVYENVIKEAEKRYGVNLRDDPVVLDAVRNMIEIIAKTKKESQ